jgi:hypothetical protein
MRAHGPVLVWGTHAGEGRASDAKGWCQQLQAWWAARTAVRKQARRATLNACWEAQHEAIRPLRAEAALEMAAAQRALTVATMPYGLSR